METIITDRWLAQNRKFYRNTVTENMIVAIIRLCCKKAENISIQPSEIEMKKNINGYSRLNSTCNYQQ